MMQEKEDTLIFVGDENAFIIKIEIKSVFIHSYRDFLFPTRSFIKIIFSLIKKTASC